MHFMQILTRGVRTNIGPAVVGVLINASGQVRSGFFFVAIITMLPIPLVWLVNAKKARREALAMAGDLGPIAWRPSAGCSGSRGYPCQ